MKIASFDEILEQRLKERRREIVTSPETGTEVVQNIEYLVKQELEKDKKETHQRNTEYAMTLVLALSKGKLEFPNKESEARFFTQREQTITDYADTLALYYMLVEIEPEIGQTFHDKQILGGLRKELLPEMKRLSLGTAALVNLARKYEKQVLTGYNSLEE